MPLSSAPLEYRYVKVKFLFPVWCALLLQKRAMVATLGLAGLLGIAALDQQLKQLRSPSESSTATRVMLIGSLDNSIIDLDGLGRAAVNRRVRNFTGNRLVLKHGP